jgi:hypothetical protein
MKLRRWEPKRVCDEKGAFAEQLFWKLRPEQRPAQLAVCIDPQHCTSNGEMSSRLPPETKVPHFNDGGWLPKMNGAHEVVKDALREVTLARARDKEQ